MCGVDFDMATNQTLGEKWYPVDIAGNGVCIDKCPNSSSLDLKEGSLICKDPMPSDCPSVSSGSPYLLFCGGCMYTLDSIDLSYIHYCVPRALFQATQNIALLAQETGLTEESVVIGKTFGYLQQFSSDVMTTWRTILAIGVGGSAIAGILTLIVIRTAILDFLIWGCAIGMPIVLGLGGLYSSSYASDLQADGIVDEDEQKEYDAFRALSYVFYIACVVTFLILIAIRNRIVLSIGIAQASARAIMNVPGTIFYPIISMLAFVFMLVIWSLALLLLSTRGEYVTNNVDMYSFSIPVTSINYSQDTIYWFWFYLFVFFWTSDFISSMGQITLAICFSKWYFSTNKSLLKCGTICTAMCCSFYHVGTAAFGSFFVGVVKLLQALLVRLKRWLEKKGAPGLITNAVFCCCQCCLCCLERCIKYMNKIAYIQTALFSYSYLKASKEAYFLLGRNAVLMSVLGYISELTVLLLQVFIITGMGVGSYVYLNSHYNDELNSVLNMVLAICVIAYFISNLFADVLAMAISTLLQCFLADKEMFSEGSPYVPEELDEFFFLKKVFF